MTLLFSAQVRCRPSRIPCSDALNRVSATRALLGLPGCAEEVAHTHPPARPPQLSVQTRLVGRCWWPQLSCTMFRFPQAPSRLPQFFVHTQLVGRCWWPVEAVMNTPSHHRVHHARNYGRRCVGQVEGLVRCMC